MTLIKLHHWLLIASLCLSGCAFYSEESKQQFENNHVEHTDKTFFDYLKTRFLGNDEWADQEEDAKQIKVQDVDLELIHHPQKKQQITWVGHSTFLLQFDGINILTDPIFSDRASPVSFAGPKRLVRLPLKMQDLPEIDIVIISHNHYDHLDEWTINRLGKGPIYYMPEALGAWFLEQGIPAENVVELKWWQTDVHNTGVKISALPSQHWSARGLFDRHKTHWASWLIEYEGHKTWFAGDTGYNPYDFKEIGEKIAGIDLALIPIGAWAPRHFMQTYHVNEAEAVEIHKDIQSKLSVGMHWGTFDLTAESPIVPEKNLEQLVKGTTVNFITMKHGATLTLPD